MNKLTFFLLLLPFFIPFPIHAACPCRSSQSTVDVFSNSSGAKVETVVRNEASGGEASVQTEITNVVNENETVVESNSPGEIRVEVKNGQVDIETSPEASPTVIIRDGSTTVEVTTFDVGEEEVVVENGSEGGNHLAETTEGSSVLVVLKNFVARLREIFFSSLPLDIL